MSVSNENGEFKLTGLVKGKYKLIVEYPDEAGEFYYAHFDTLVVFNKTSIKKAKFIVPCLYCDCWQNSDRKGALDDIQKGKLQLWVSPVGISGEMMPQANDEEFQKKYSVTYVAFGCTFPEFECMEGYNAVVFDYLDKKFGKKWRKEARTDVIYLRKRLKID